MQVLVMLGGRQLLMCADSLLDELSASDLQRAIKGLWLRAAKGRLPLSLNCIQRMLRVLPCNACAGRQSLLGYAGQRLLMCLNGAQLLLQVLCSAQRLPDLPLQGLQRL